MSDAALQRSPKGIEKEAIVAELSGNGNISHRQTLE